MPPRREREEVGLDGLQLPDPFCESRIQLKSVWTRRKAEAIRRPQDAESNQHRRDYRRGQSTRVPSNSDRRYGVSLLRQTPAQHLTNREQSEHGNHENAGVLCCKRESRRNADDRESPHRRGLDVSVECVNRREHEARESRVGGHASAVGQEVWLEHDQREGDEGGACAEKLSGRQEYEQREQNGEDRRRHAGAKHDGVRVVAEKELFPVQKGLVHEETIPNLRDLQRHGQERCCREHLHDGRMFGVEPEVLMCQGPVTGENMVAFVPGRRFPRHREGQLKDESGQKTGDTHHYNSTLLVLQTSPHRLLKLHYTCEPISSELFKR